MVKAYSLEARKEAVLTCEIRALLGGGVRKARGRQGKERARRHMGGRAEKMAKSSVRRYGGLRAGGEERGDVDDVPGGVGGKKRRQD